MDEAESMALVILVGMDAALLEGVAQTLGSAGHRVRLAHGIDEARRVAAQDAPMLLVVERRLAIAARTLGVRTAPGGATILFRTADDDQGGLSPALQRVVLAEVTLPLERQRLTALASSVVQRARQVGRSREETPPEAHRPL
jgi:DNA-binding NtrC family response regulator